MKSELDKHKEGLELALRALGSAALIFDDKGFGHFSEAVRGDIHIIEKAVAPDPPEYEEIEEIVGWVNVYQRESGTLRSGLVHDTENDAERDRHTHPNERFLSCQPIRVTVKREKKRPVERTVTVEAYIDKEGDVADENRGGYAAFTFRAHPEAFCKRGTLTFTWTEDPTT